MASNKVHLRGFESVSKELRRIRSQQEPAIAQAIKDTAIYGQITAVDAVFNRYSFKSRSYVDDNIRVQIETRFLQARIYSRYRASTLTRFVNTRRTRNAKTKPARQVSSGYSISLLRNQSHIFRGAFQFTGRNGNALMAIREKGDNSWRDIQQSSYGPSVAGSFGVIRPEIDEKIGLYLRKRYTQHIT
ncbi:hypothetical protein Sps_05127 [Shewanella psychrophila]|uniref:Prophage minor tail protein Z (GPZ) n=1 Tax=Shewanella psychrophila TaxID=225848 RepID=A0A1S6HX92_9GAMM|nr:hypothetical protein [Shewanella psychrophila]AQS40196.1 hypothetical protein Sps_05127 [Shewanella psychrophila]